MDMRVVVGLTFRNLVMVDLDGMSFKQVKQLCIKACEKYRLEGFIILKSSSRNYHAVFDRVFKDWSETINVISRIAIMSGNPETWKWVCMQIIKEASTLRVGFKPLNPNRFKPPPRIVYRHGCQKHGIHEFLRERRKVLNILKHLPPIERRRGGEEER